MRARLTTTDLAILVAFTRPFVAGQRFASPAPNNKILEELGEAGLHMDLDTLRTHLRNLYAKFGVEDGLTPAEKRVRLVELVYDNRMIPGWGAEDAAEGDPPPAPPPRSSSATFSPIETVSAPAEPHVPLANRTPSHTGSREKSRLALASGALRRRPWVPAGIAAALIGLGAWTIIASSSNGPSANDAPKSPSTKVIDLGWLRNPQGRVNYCTGKDVAKSSDGTMYQHQKSVDDFNAKFEPNLHANLIHSGSAVSGHMAAILGSQAQCFRAFQACGGRERSEKVGTRLS